MILTPDSIRGANTLALEALWLERLQALPINALKIDFENEVDPQKLTMWIETFGVPRELLPIDMEDFKLRELLKKIIPIYQLSGTQAGVKMLAEALGASGVTVHTGAYCESLITNNFSISILLDNNFTDAEMTTFANDFIKLFQIFEPISLWVNDIKKDSKGLFNNNFNSKHN